MPELVRCDRRAWLLFFWPTLWFWPSSIGKEAVLLLAVGLVTLGYVGRHERIHWIPIVAGFALALAIRPHLAGVLAVAICVAEWTSREWTFARLLQSVVMSALAVWLLVTAFGMLSLADIEAAEQLLRTTAEQTNQGGSAFDTGGGYATAIPMAFVNILFRPFITEANSPMALVSSLEMMAVLGARVPQPAARAVQSAVVAAQSAPEICDSVHVSLRLMIGLTFQNFGIIARQRALVMPMLLLMFVAAPGAPGAQRAARHAAAPRRRVWRSDAEHRRSHRPVPPHELAGTRVARSRPHGAAARPKGIARRHDPHVSPGRRRYTLARRSGNRCLSCPAG